ncbi:MAG: hypothetical protein CL468_07695 [Acidimicrobiaceae bacterium]|nr:hypothetical protein [Acidimicrobiaceae bacterium]
MSSASTSTAYGRPCSRTTERAVILRRQRPVAFQRVGDRTLIRLEEEERLMLVDLAGQFRSVVADDHDPGLRRLYPTAYPNNPEWDADYASLVHDDLVRLRLEAADTVEATAGSPSLADDELADWMQVLNGLRLLLGTRLDISEEDQFDPEADDAPARALLAWLGFLLEEAVAAAGEPDGTNA